MLEHRKGKLTILKCHGIYMYVKGNINTSLLVAKLQKQLRVSWAGFREESGKILKVNQMLHYLISAYSSLQEEVACHGIDMYVKGNINSLLAAQSTETTRGFSGVSWVDFQGSAQNG